MALPAHWLSKRSLPALAAPTVTPLCTVHTCRRCRGAIASADPCSSYVSHARVCRGCQGQEEALKHLRLNRSVWAASLAGRRRP